MYMCMLFNSQIDYTYIVYNLSTLCFNQLQKENSSKHSVHIWSTGIYLTTILQTPQDKFYRSRYDYLVVRRRLVKFVWWCVPNIKLNNIIFLLPRTFRFPKSDFPLRYHYICTENALIVYFC